MLGKEENTIEPSSLKRVRDWIRQNVPNFSENRDRRGFRLLQWPAVRKNDAAKPTELSLEHEVRLKPSDLNGLRELQGNLYKDGGVGVSRVLLPGIHQFSDLIIARYDRPIGPQSVDTYYDCSDKDFEIITRMLSIRKRTKTSKFMTWASDNQQVNPLNIELPFVEIGESGLIARLEFNWIGSIDCNKNALSQIDETEAIRDPLFITSKLESINLSDLAPVIEHTTYREKFGFQRRTNENKTEELFVLNIDHVIAQSLISGRIGNYIDIDISSVKVMEANQLQMLTELAMRIADRYDLVANLTTKVWRDAYVTGHIPQ